MEEIETARVGAHGAGLANASAAAPGVCVAWRYEAERAPAGPPAEGGAAGGDAAGAAAIAIPPLRAEAVAALCARHGARFEATAAGASLHLEVRP